MKKLLLVLLIAPMIGKSQMLNLPVSDIIGSQGFELYQTTVPVGKAWQWVGLSTFSEQTEPNYNVYGRIRWLTLSGYTNQYHIFKEGQSLEIGYNQDFDCVDCFFTFIEYDLDAQNLAYNSPNKTTPTLYPNPTSSLLALNSNKEYYIEVYDMAGNKVMALKGNTIDMSHLSSATYIVRALDKVENEEVSYRVVKK
tara:strand:- start:557 stop:1144 length:588 start_codon:yes stop_codon:yes gene_type:complete